MIPIALLLSLLLTQDAPAAATPIELTDETVTMPARIATGVVAFTVANAGAAPHDLRFVRLNAGHTLDQFKAWKESGKPIPEWIVSSGGLGAIGPGMTVEYTASLAPGSYVVLSDDRRVQALQVTPAKGAAVTPPEPDLTVRLHDHGFQLTAPVPPGRPLWRVQNTGSEPHQMLIVRLPDGANEYQQRAWISSGSRGASPGEPFGGILELAPGGEAWFRAPLTPGRYILICGEQEQEGRHFDLGMIYRFEIE
ncbi:MAG TPA: hypothetical protein VGY57_14915 [Vicinamibacterales bacterium]|nr:hypothetical protein [Vicinamibacterales bacterium]